MASGRYYWGFLLLGFFALQIAFWQLTLKRLPEMGIVPGVVGKETLDALSFGDRQFIFRLMGFTLGNAGDTFGRTTSLKEYDLNKVQQWFTLLDQYDARSDLLPTMAAYYFSKTQKTEDVRHMVAYLYQHAVERAQEKWWWLVQAIYLAQHRLKDDDLAFKMAKPLMQEDLDIPLWARQMPAFLYEKRGEFDAALGIIETILKHSKEIPEKELRFMQYFVEERLDKMEEMENEAAKQLTD